MANTYLLSRKANARANDISYLKLIKYIFMLYVLCFFELMPSHQKMIIYHTQVFFKMECQGDLTSRAENRG